MARVRVGLNPKQEKAVMLLSAGMGTEQASGQVGVSESTIRQWMRQETFRAEMRRTLDRMRQAFEGRMMYLTQRAGYEAELALKKPGMTDEKLKVIHIILTTAARLSGRYKELQVEGYAPPPMFLIPGNVRMSVERVEPQAPGPVVIDVKALAQVAVAGSNGHANGANGKVNGSGQ